MKRAKFSLEGEEIEEGNRSLNTVMSDTINQFNSYNVYRIPYNV